MEVRCVVCGKMFAVDDNDYEGEWENFCSHKCQEEWFKQRNEGVIPMKEVEPFVWTIDKEKLDELDKERLRD